jgi:hypothetical protein
MTHKIASAPFNTSDRDPTEAPAASKSESEMEALSPAPFSTATVAPRPMNFFTVSGIEATRVSGSLSRRTAIFKPAA